MTFDLTAEQQEWSRRARDVSQAAVARLAHAIDEQGIIPSSVREALSAESFGNPFSAGMVSGSIVLEEIAAVSAGVAVAIGLQWVGAPPPVDRIDRDGWPGLRGGSLDVQPRGSGALADRTRLVLCAVAIGLGRASISQAVDVMKSRGIRPSGDEPAPHWALADAAAELDAARLLVLRAAQTVEREDASDLALSMASALSAAAAEHAVEAASLIAGADGYRRGSDLDRFTRDARTLKLLLSQ